MAKKKSTVKKHGKKPAEKYITICPQCKSRDVEMDRENPVQPAMGLPPLYICNRCGHSGGIFPEVAVKDIRAFQEEAKREGLTDASPDKTPKADDRYGAFQANVVWKFTAPFMLLVGIYFLLFKNGFAGWLAIVLGLLMLYIAYFRKKKLVKA